MFTTIRKKTGATAGLLHKNRLKSLSFRSTLAVLLLSPAVSLIILELLTENLTQLPRIAILLNLLLLYFLLALFLLFFGRIHTALILYNVLILLLGLIQYYVGRFRGRSFMLSDITCAWTALQVAGGYSYALSFTAGAAVLAAVVWMGLSLLVPDRKTKKFLIIRKIAVILLLAAGLRLLADRSFTSQHDIFSVNMWDPDGDYRTKGYLLALLSQIQYLTVDVPENYSEEAAREIAEKYSRIYDAKHAGDSLAVQPENLIVIMNESWSDFRLLDTYQYKKTVTPFIDSLTENVTKGYVRVPVYSSGTANTEYEVLTGNSTFLLEENSPAAYQVHSQKNEYGMASTLSAQGYRTIAMHPESALNYNRKQVYPRMRFDEFLSKDNWDDQYLKKIRRYVSDKSCYDYIAQIYSEKEAGEKLFTFLVTMQNHAGYSIKKFKSTVNLGYGTDCPEAEQYLSLLKKSDKAFQSLIEHFENVPEPTMIVMFGDHWPNLQDAFFDTLFENGTSAVTAEENRARLSTPFVLWTNYERESQTGITMSANYFGSYILQQAGAILPPYNKFLLEMKDELPVLWVNEVMTADGTWYSAESLPEHSAGLVAEYRILQYNNVFAGSRKIDALYKPENH